jgi:hypothetical protein
MRLGNLPPISRDTRLSAFQVGRVHLETYFSQLYGSLTLGGKPLGRDAAVRVGGGTGYASKEPGEYRAAVEGQLEVDAQFEISTCDGELKATFLSDAPVRPRTRYDVDIPDNELVVEVSDTFTRAPLVGASVRVTILSTRIPRRPVLERKLTTVDAEGVARASMKYVPERQIAITVSHTGYQKQTLQPFTMPRGEKKMIEVQLVPQRGSGGRINSSHPFDEASLIWFTPAGEETERAELAEDGSFFYVRSHAADETLAVVSRSHPLWVLRAPDVGRGQTIELRFPDAAPSRTFDILSNGDPQKSRYIALFAGAMLIPFGALQTHQQLRKLPALLRGPGPMTIRDIAETAPISVALGPFSEEVPGRVRDPFALPRYETVPRKKLESGVTRLILGP